MCYSSMEEKYDSIVWACSPDFFGSQYFLLLELYVYSVNCHCAAHLQAKHFFFFQNRCKWVQNSVCRSQNLRGHIDGDQPEKKNEEVLREVTELWKLNHNEMT